jgi:aldehyde dehydrogenase (NAD+)
VNIIDGIYVGGGWQRSTGGESITVVNPYTEEPIGRAAVSSAVEVDAAVRSAHRAFTEGGWPETPLDQRIEICRRIAGLITDRAGELATTASASMGAPFASWRTLGDSAGLIEMFIESVRRIPFEYLRQDGFGNTLIRRRPVGPVAGIVPWNGPIRSEVKKVIPAILAGCTIVLKSAPETPFGGAALGEICTEAGLPPGVVNVVFGGASTGEALVTHPLIRKIAFTGSTDVGRRIATLAAQEFKRLQLELGGKSAAIVLDDVDLDETLPWLDAGVFRAAGQICFANTRIVVARSRYDEVVDAMAQRARAHVLGDPFDPATTMGPLVAQRQRDRVRGYIEAGKAEGARLVTGGGMPDDQPRGWFVEPTVFSDVENSMKIAQEEIFGPVASVIPFDDEDDAVRIANDSRYGLGGAVHSSDPLHALRVAGRVESGYIAINRFGIGGSGPFGGVKNSGIGRECGIEGFDSFLEYISYPVSADFAHDLAKTVGVE